MAADAHLAGQRVFVTGATGFLGSHLVRALRARDADVIVLDGDIRDRAVVAARVAAARPSIVFHLAAYGTTPLQPDEARMRAVNTGGVEHLWQALDAFPCRIVQTGTCAEYGAAFGPIAETTECHPSSVYAATVHDAVLFSQERARRTGRPLVVLRPFGPFGPGDRPERLVPHVVDALVAGRRAAVTAGEFCRDYSYVDLHVWALIRAAAMTLDETARVYNIGSGKPVAVRTLVEAIAALVGGDAADRVDFGAAPYRADDRVDRYADIAAARRDLGFEPRVTLVEGLRRTVQAARAEAAR